MFLEEKSVETIKQKEERRFTKQGEAPFAKSVDLLDFLLARGHGPGTYAS
jgi:hypothetical protein